jgi:hypothetical protein
MTDADFIMQKLGITKVPAAYFEWGGFRYGRMEEAVRRCKAARLDQALSFHQWFGRHIPDVDANRWDRGGFVSRCSICRVAMIKLPGLDWQLEKTVR